MSQPNSKPIKIQTQFFAPAAAEPNGQAMRTVIPDMGLDDEDEAAEAVTADEVPPSGDSDEVDAPEVAPEAQVTVEPAPLVSAGDQNATVVVGVVPVWGLVIGWLLAIIALSAATKRGLKALGLKDKLGAVRWRRWLFVIPLVTGIVVSLLAGPPLGRQFGLEIDPWLAVLFLGPGSGMAAGWFYDVGRAVLAPVLVALLPEVLISLLNAIPGVTLGDDAKAAAKNAAGSMGSPKTEENGLLGDDSSAADFEVDPAGLAEPTEDP